ncbi:MAG: biotin carboxylase [Mycobacterium sp.]
MTESTRRTTTRTVGTKAAAPRTRRATKAPAPAAVPVPDAVEIVSAAPEVSVGTDAGFASSPSAAGKRRLLRNMSEVRHFFRTNDVPVYFVGATPFNLLGLDRWVRRFTFIAYYDAWGPGQIVGTADVMHPHVFTPSHKPYQEFASGEEINNWLLRNPEVRAHMQRGLTPGVRPKVAMVFFDAETEAICAELGYDLILPPAELREHLDSKIVTTRLGDEAGAPSVPNVLTNVDDWEQLTATAEKAGLGGELVVQTPYGDSGKTTFFISSEADWRKHADDIVGQDIKVMRRINNRPVAVEAVLTRCGTVVGPFMSELTGYDELTPYRGGWCGNEMFPDVLPAERRAKATQLVRRLGDRLAAEGYRGYFEVDVLVDTDDGEVYLGELNPRISGATSITNVTAGAYADVPLFLFHLLEYMDVDFELDVDEINDRWEQLAGADVWSQMVIKETGDTVEQLVSTPATGHYALDASGTLVFRRAALDWHQLQDEAEAFFLRVYPVGDYRWKGADLGVLVTKGRLQRDAAQGGTALTIRARHLIDSIRAQYSGVPLAGPASATPMSGVTSL